jgi:predicted CDP-diglyceride synthetase/phosphatidate cytidylyltransferase
MLQLDLADTSIRAYKKRSEKISLHLRSYLLVKTITSFNLSYYMKSIDCLLILEEAQKLRSTTHRFLSTPSVMMHFK